MSSESKITKAQPEKLKDFPRFLRHEFNEAAVGGPSPGLSGYVFEGKDGSQLVMWTSTKGGVSHPHSHDYDEYCIVIQGETTCLVDGKEITYRAGDECYIPAGVVHSGTFTPGYRAIDGFGGRRVKRARETSG